MHLILYVPGLIGGFVLTLVTIFKKEWSPITVPIYAILEGLAPGRNFFSVYVFGFPGIVPKNYISDFGNHVFSIIRLQNQSNKTYRKF